MRSCSRLYLPTGIRGALRRQIPLLHFPSCPLGGGTGRRRRRQPKEQEEVEAAGFKQPQAAFQGRLLSRFYF